MARQHNENVLASAPLMMLVERMRGLQGLRIMNELGDGTGGVVFFLQNEVSMKSWGEDITVHMSIYDDTRTLVEMESKSSLPTQLVDMGKNKQNVALIKARLFGEDVPVQPV